jgi:trehalose 6-phosphate synthase/phosphatase
MRGALHVNPWKISEIANAFYQALNMADDERMRRISTACEFVTRVTTQRWALAVMLDLKGVHKSINPIQYSGAGLGLGYRLLGMDVGFVSLDFSKVAKAFKNSRSRLILVDYGGTIASNDNVSTRNVTSVTTGIQYVVYLPTAPRISLHSTDGQLDEISNGQGTKGAFAT